jgi:mannosyl-oligosaccharide alpha-1,2-mannosidase
MRVAEGLAYTCYELYRQTPTGLAPSVVEFSQGKDFEPVAAHYALRPETAESLFHLHALTGQPAYREWAWQIFEAIDKRTRLKDAYGTYKDVYKLDYKPKEQMEPYFLSETLKYLYLIQVGDLSALCEWLNLTQTIAATCHAHHHHPLGPVIIPSP